MLLAVGADAGTIVILLAAGVLLLGPVADCAMGAVGVVSAGFCILCTKAIKKHAFQTPNRQDHNLKVNDFELKKHLPLLRCPTRDSATFYASFLAVY